MARNIVSWRRPPRRDGFLGKRRNQPLFRFVPDLCQRIADLAILADLVRRKNSKLRALNGGRGTDSVHPGSVVWFRCK